MAVMLSAILVVSCAPRWTVDPSLEKSEPLRSVAQRRNIHIGAAVSADPLQFEPIYLGTLTREFNLLTPENAMKFGRLQPKPSHFDFKGADQIIGAAHRMSMQVRGHTLVWHHQLPPWLTGRTWTRDELIRILRDHVTTVVSRYRGKIMAWDVVNEAVADDGTLRESFWLSGIGPEYIAMAFEWAHAADPDALLFYNDFGGEAIGSKSDAIYSLVKRLSGSGVPIHGVGFQMHVRLDEFPSPSDVRINMARLAKLGLSVHITEMDVRIKGRATPRKLAQQAGVYRQILGVCLAQENCSAFVMWGFTDAHSWIPGFFKGWDHGLIFDEGYRPKPAYHALWEALLGQ